MQYYKELLAKFGLENFDISGDWRVQYSSYFYKDIIIYDSLKKTYVVNNNLEYKFNRFISKGGYNDIKECGYNSNIYALRSPSEFTCKFDSFAENVKTIFLYCYAKAFITIKIFPDIYFFCYNKITRKYYLIMEHIPITFRQYIYTLHYSFINDILQKIINIYAIFDKHSLWFRHGDLTTNNIMIHNGAPIFIDFGMSSFSLFGKYYNNSESYNYKHQGINLLHDMIILYNSLSFSQINLTRLLPRDSSFILSIPQIYFSGKTIHYFIRMFDSGNYTNDRQKRLDYIVNINKQLDYNALLSINNRLYFIKEGSLNLTNNETQRIFNIITNKKYLFCDHS